MSERHFHTLDCVGTDCHDPNLAAPPSAPAAPLREVARLFFSADDIDAALATIRGSVTREESIVMAAAGAAAAAMRFGGTIGCATTLSRRPTVSERVRPRGRLLL